MHGPVIFAQGGVLCDGPSLAKRALSPPNDLGKNLVAICNPLLSSSAS
jgi:hypothetical protein